MPPAWILIFFATLLITVRCAATGGEAEPKMKWADDTRMGRPFAKDPSVIRFGGRYLMYFSLPPASDKKLPPGWAIGIAESKDLANWKRIGELLPEQECDAKGLCAPGARVLDGRVHLFYQTYGNGPKDAICHAVSDDGVHFTRDATNPIFRPTGDWTCGRAIDAEIIEHGDKLLLYCATRDPAFKVQMVAAAAADRKSDFGRASWKQLHDGPVLKPELPWEKKCIEAPTLLKRGDTLFMFYAGGYNNEPQQVGCAASADGVHFTRLFEEPLLPNGKPGSWNGSESGHPGVFVDDDGQTYLFYQGNNDKGKTWFLSRVKIGWKDEKPNVMPEE
jgi:beta-1,2-mannobiose phosphorylase / 1,2-beta-oligomannan phosphorylase